MLVKNTEKVVMPRGHRAGRKNQIRRLALNYKCEPAVTPVVLGTTSTPCVVNTTTPSAHVSGVSPAGNWVLQKINSIEEIDTTLRQPVVWRLIPIDQ